MISSVTILGSTGSIGVQTIDVCRRYGIRIEALAAGRNADILFEQIKSCRPRQAALEDSEAAARLDRMVREAGLSTEVFCGREAIVGLARETEAELVMCAMVGMAGLAPTVAALEGGHQIALANKEALVTGGDIVMPLAERQGVLVRPVDSEHSAIWQCLWTGGINRLKKIWLTASGGPFRGKKAEELEQVTVKQALAHPTWTMGAKITIDSATMMNKGLEMIEACHLFQVRPEQVEIMVHPQSIIHSMVEWQDGSVIAQLGHADMRLPIQLALSWPDRWPNEDRHFDPFSAGASNLTAEPPDEGTFRCIRLAKQAAAAGGFMPTVMNAANEVAVAAFLAGEIGFMDIPRIIEAAMDRHAGTAEPELTVDNLYAVDAEVRRTAGR